MKKCLCCKKEKTKEEFYRTSKGYYRSYCIPCSKEKITAYKNTRQGRSSILKNAYGLTLDELEIMYKAQKGCCKICGEFRIGLSVHGGLYVDHDHVTDIVRGLLCNSCNVALGLFKDNKDILLSAVTYLKDNGPVVPN